MKGRAGQERWEEVELVGCGGWVRVDWEDAGAVLRDEMVIFKILSSTPGTNSFFRSSEHKGCPLNLRAFLITLNHTNHRIPQCPLTHQLDLFPPLLPCPALIKDYQVPVQIKSL